MRPPSLGPCAFPLALFHGGGPVGRGSLEVGPVREGLRARLSVQVQLAAPPLEARLHWESRLDAQGFSRFFQERVEVLGGGRVREVRVFQVERLEEEGLVLVSQGKESLAYPDLTPYHDPLSLLLYLPRLALGPGEAVGFPMPGGRAYVERLPGEGLAYRLRPGLTLVEVAQGWPLRVAQQVGSRVFEVRFGL